MSHLRLLAFIVAAAPAPLGAAVIVVSGSNARTCYEAAESSGPTVASSMQACNDALELEPLGPRDRAATFVNRGILLLHGGRDDAALRDFDTAISIDPAGGEAYLNKASVSLYRRNDPKAAAALFTSALRNGTRRPAAAYFGRAAAYEDQGFKQAAYADYSAAARLAPTWQDVRRELARFRTMR